MKDKVVAIVLSHELDIDFLTERLNAFSNLFDNVVVHYDLKSSCEVFSKLKNSTNKNIYFLDERLNVYWGGDDIVLAQLRMISFSLERKLGNKFVLLSTSHYPLPNISKESINDYVRKIKFAAFDSKKMPVTQVIKRIFIPFKKVNKKSTLFDFGGAKNIFIIFYFFLYYGWPRWGSNWVALSEESANKAVEYIPLFEKGWFDKIKIIDEMFFQNIIDNDFDKSPTYFEFSKGNTGSPRTFQESEVHIFEKKSQEYLFIRKVVKDS